MQLISPLMSVLAACDSPLGATPSDTSDAVHMTDTDAVSTSEAAFIAEIADPMAVEIGHGTSPFAPLADGDALVLERGSQGLQHVYFSVEAAIPGGFHSVSYALSFSPALQPPFALGPTRLSVPFVATADDLGGKSQAIGILAVIEAPEPFLGATGLSLHVRVDSRGGELAGHATRPIAITWP